MACATLRPNSYHRHSPLQQQKKSPVPCKFWLQGRCNRSDSCRFSHDTLPDSINTAPTGPSRSATTWKRPTTPKLPVAERQSEEEATNIAAPSTQATASGSDATGVSAMNWPILVVTCEDGRICLDDAERPERKRVHQLHSSITCVVDGPVQQLLHPGLLILGLASGEIAAISSHLHEQSGVCLPSVQIIPGPLQSCGKVLCVVSARTHAHSLLLLAGYENGAILCWNFDSVRATFSPLCTVQFPTASASVVSVDISDDGDDFGEGSSSSSAGQKKEQLLYSASSDGCITVWNLENFSRLQVLPPQPAPVTKLLSAGRYVFCGCADGSIKAWGPSTTSSVDQEHRMELLYTQPSPRQAATSVVDLCGQRTEHGRHMLFAAYKDDTVGMWELPSFKEVEVMHVSFGIRAMDVAATSPDGRAVLLLAGTGGCATCSMIQC